MVAENNWGFWKTKQLTNSLCLHFSFHGSFPAICPHPTSDRCILICIFSGYSKNYNKRYSSRNLLCARKCFKCFMGVNSLNLSEHFNIRTAIISILHIKQVRHRVDIREVVQHYRFGIDKAMVSSLVV